MIIRELCVENFTSIPKAIKKGVERIELCDNLAVGGTTPSYGVIQEAHHFLVQNNAKTTLAVMIRPRSGDFVYDPYELKIMETDILKAIEAGADALVFGCLTKTNEIDSEAMETLLIASQGLPVTFHMAFDEIPKAKQINAITQLATLGVEKILLHGDSLDHALNISAIKSLTRASRGKISLMIGGGVTKDNFEKLAKACDTTYVHGSKII